LWRRQPLFVIVSNDWQMPRRDGVMYCLGHMQFSKTASSAVNDRRPPQWLQRLDLQPHPGETHPPPASAPCWHCWHWATAVDAPRLAANEMANHNRGSFMTGSWRVRRDARLLPRRRASVALHAGRGRCGRPASRRSGELEFFQRAVLRRDYRQRIEGPCATFGGTGLSYPIRPVAPAHAGR
jgi:hypothetical protein